MGGQWTLERQKESYPEESPVLLGVPPQVEGWGVLEDLGGLYHLSCPPAL